MLIYVIPSPCAHNSTLALSDNNSITFYDFWDLERSPSKNKRIYERALRSAAHEYIMFFSSCHRCAS